MTVDDHQPTSDADAGGMSKVRFQDLHISSEAKTAMKDSFGYEYLTEVQARTFDTIMKGLDVIVRAKTGAGKTLSFLLPAIERLRNHAKNTSSFASSIDILIVSPVRELSIQIFQEAEKLTKHIPGFRALCMIGGVPWQEDIEALDAAGSDLIILVVTPGRLQTHLSKTPGFAERVSQVQVFVLDEVDQLAGDIFRPATEEIISFLAGHSQRQSLFYSATMSDAVTDLVKKGAKPDYVYIDLLESDHLCVPVQIEQTYAVVQTENMSATLWSAVEASKCKDEQEPKLVIILMTGRIAAYYADAFRKSGSKLEVFEIHSRRSQKQRTDESERFRIATGGLLFTSDITSRGLDYPGITEVIQLGAPHSKAEYIHRLGRTGRGGNAGRGLLLLHEFEKGFLQELADLPITETLAQISSDVPNFLAMDIAQNVKAQAYYSRINHVMRNAGELSVLEILQEAKRFAASIGALDQEGRPPEITLENAEKMGIANIDDPAVYIVAVATPVDPPPKGKKK